jgi:glycosyltransferase involved in cell wall biosynthesis
MTQRLKVLVSAYACNPFKGSEEGVGWGWIRAISEYHDLWVITADFHRGDIERALSQEPRLSGRVKFYFVRNRPWHFAPTKGWASIEGSVLKPIMNYAYGLWQRDAYKLALDLQRKVGFDLAHQLTYVGFRFPGHLWKLDVPFVWGPIGGLENTPWRFLAGFGFSGFVYYAGRNIINSLQKRVLLAPQKAFRKARGGIIAATEGIRNEIRRWYREESEVICEIGPPPTTAENHSVRETREPLRLSWSGQHLPGKALPLLLRALVSLPADVKWQLDVLGEGPSTTKWQKLAQKIGVNEKCRWHGQMKRDDAIEIVHRSHIFIITSLKDLTSTVLLEAISQGVPVICPDHCGFSNVVTEDCGIKISLENPRQFESDLANAIKELANDEQRRRHLSKGALQRIREFSWEKKAKLVDTIYRKAISGIQNVRN